MSATTIAFPFSSSVSTDSIATIVTGKRLQIPQQRTGARLSIIEKEVAKIHEYRVVLRKMDPKPRAKLGRVVGGKVVVHDVCPVVVEGKQAEVEASEAVLLQEPEKEEEIEYVNYDECSSSEDEDDEDEFPPMEALPTPDLPSTPKFSTLDVFGPSIRRISTAPWAAGSNTPPVLQLPALDPPSPTSSINSPLPSPLFDMHDVERAEYFDRIPSPPPSINVGQFDTDCNCKVVIEKPKGTGLRRVLSRLSIVPMLEKRRSMISLRSQRSRDSLALGSPPTQEVTEHTLNKKKSRSWLLTALQGNFSSLSLSSASRRASIIERPCTPIPPMNNSAKFLTISAPTDFRRTSSYGDRVGKAPRIPSFIAEEGLADKISKSIELERNAETLA
ncbi:hypothetical protein SAICODRAFT_31564 [Saitoella complicata NRRL Y-17804]|uniref:Uncharacterized protein n=1 Tax=Saitoella complicata (strain BCRC 22490 / CBS 7301 / JCM 7358 / NBRC 10748 / NRRL Y-17804) TaxID=698492 RepID=A0A0E9NMZ4_SAICN|nr:uncharacterized protein SAICODRAFT_31564 [Saitoella complicata NRRL Y-17804]ODQ51077.1 hypothetical protein SAICODRAFT_31564 [Saitoella complicata NRRL Y-17804]GAO51247.1 hypothetical protein G7K_5355-t1 [Saitoella complicata NRRL Y-17804]